MAEWVRDRPVDDLELFEPCAAGSGSCPRNSPHWPRRAPPSPPPVSTRDARSRPFGPGLPTSTVEPAAGLDELAIPVRGRLLRHLRPCGQPRRRSSHLPPPTAPVRFSRTTTFSSPARPLLQEHMPVSADHRSPVTSTPIRKPDVWGRAARQAAQPFPVNPNPKVVVSRCRVSILFAPRVPRFYRHFYRVPWYGR